MIRVGEKLGMKMEARIRKVRYYANRCVSLKRNALFVSN